MASEQDRRTIDFQELQEIVAQHSHIRIIQTEGDPPDCYEIEYNLTGLVKNTDGSIVKAARHLMLLTLPFGYPHFPPAVKPLTPIFHPDMDTDAVRISSYWHEVPSLAKLVLHLGDMICGQDYELEEPFNQEAADWYAAHADELPCKPAAAEAGGADELDLDLGLADIDEPAHAQDIDLSSALEPALEIEDMTDLEPAEADGGAELSFELESPQPVQDIAAGLTGQEEEQGSQDDSDEEDFGLGLELDLAPEPEPEAEQPPQDFGPKLEEIRTHVRKKEMEIAARLLAGLPAALPEAEDLRLRVRNALAERDELLAELKAFEDDDNFDEAKKVFKKIKAVAADTPDLAEIGRRLEQSQNMLDAFSLPSQQTEAEDEFAAAEEEGGPSPSPKKKKKAAKEPPRKEKQAVRQEKKEISKVKRQIVRTVHREVPVMPFAIAAGVAAVIVVIGLIYTRDTNNLLNAQLAWQDAQQLFRQRDCQKAEAKANAALAILKTVLTPLPAKVSMRKEIAELTASEDYQLCKKGQGKYKDQTLPLAEVKDRKELDKLIAAAEHALDKGDMSTAILSYEKAWKFAADKLPDKDDAIELKKRTNELILKNCLPRVEEAQQVKDWETVVKYSRQGIDAAKELGDKETEEKLKKILTESLFNSELHRFKQLFVGAHGQWQQLLEQLKTLQKRLQENPDAATPEKKLEIEQLMARSQFYQFLSLASEAYSSKGDSDAAISYYEQALSLLDKKQHLFTTAEQATAEQIKSTIQRIRISDMWNKAAVEERDGKISLSLKHYREIKELLQRLDLKNKDEDLQLFEKEVDSRISRLQKQLKDQLINDWLDKNYKRIFAEAYPASRSEKLNTPQLDLMRTTNGKELYRIRCREGRMYIFELYYLYDPATNHWSPCPNCH